MILTKKLFSLTTIVMSQIQECENLSIKPIICKHLFSNLTNYSVFPFTFDNLPVLIINMYIGFYILSLLYVCSVSVMSRKPVLIFTPHKREHLLTVLESWFEALNWLCALYSHPAGCRIALILWRMSYSIQAFKCLRDVLTELIAMLALSKSSKRLGFTIFFGLLFTKQSSEFIALTRSLNHLVQKYQPLTFPSWLQIL